MYEKEVFQLGRWNNYEELETALTLEELFETYDGIMSREFRTQKFLAQAMGAEFEETDVVEEDGVSALHRINDNLRGERTPDKDGSVPAFDRNVGIGYGTIGG